MVLELVRDEVKVWMHLKVDDSGSRYLQVKEASFTYKWNKGWFMIARDLVKLVNGEMSLAEVKLHA